MGPMSSQPQPQPQPQPSYAPPVDPAAVPAEGHQDPRVVSDERTWAAISHGLSFVEGGIIGPLVVYLIKKDKSPFVAFHALQSLYFGLVFLVLVMLTFITILGPIAVGILYWVFEILATVKSMNGEWYKLPIVGEWALRTHPMPAVYPAQGPPVTGYYYPPPYPQPAQPPGSPARGAVGAPPPAKPPA